MKVLFTGDFLRPFSDGTPGNQVSNVRWLADVLSPCLTFLCEKEISVVMELPGCSGSDMLRELGLSCSIDGWMAAMDMSDWTSISSQIDQLIGDSTLVLGFELPRPFKKYLDSKNIPWVDFAISPYRFGDDLFLMADSSNELIRSRMKVGRLVDSDFAKYVGPLKARMRREIKNLSGKKILIVFGQTEIDRSIFKSGLIARWTDFEDEIKQLTLPIDVIYFKPHPYASQEATFENIQFFSQFASVVELNEHAYETLVRDQPATFLTLSSGVTFEAACFGKTVNHLIPLPYKVDTNSDSNCSSGFFVLGSAMLSRDFWEHVLTGKDNGPLVLPSDVSANRLRESLGVWWSFENHDRDLRLARWANNPRFESMENRMNNFMDVIKSADERNTIQRDLLDRLDSSFKRLSESLVALTARDGEIALLNEKIAQWDGELCRRDAELRRRDTELCRLRQSLYGVTWHTHLYRGWKRFVGDKQYNECVNHSPKRYTNLQVPWHTHLYRAGVGLFVKGEKPWHTHLFRACQSMLGDKRYAPRATTEVAAGAFSTADCGTSPARRFARYRDEAGI